MKKILTIAVASLAVAAIADTTFSPNIGVTTLSLSLKNNVIPVQFKSLETADDNVTAGALVCTNNIDVGSHLYVYQNGTYTAWTLTATGWAPLDVVTKADGITAGVPADGQTLSTGTAIWLSFPTKPGSAKLVSVYGRVATATATMITENASTLVCNMTGDSKSFGTLLTGVTPKTGDKIRFVTDTYEGEFSYSEKNSAWKNFKTGDTGLPALAPYQGFWYLSNGGSGTITW